MMFLNESFPSFSLQKFDDLYDFSTDLGHSYWLVGSEKPDFTIQPQNFLTSVMQQKPSDNFSLIDTMALQAIETDIGYTAISDLESPSSDTNGDPVLNVELSIFVAGLETGLLITQSSVSQVATSVNVEITLADGTTQNGRVEIEAGNTQTIFILSLEMLEGLGFVRGGISTITLSDAENASLEDGGSQQTYTSALGITRDMTGTVGGPLRFNTESPFFGTDESDSVVGSSSRDHIILNDGDDFASGGFGEDFLRGGPGNDVLVGGQGRSKITGNDGNDIIYGSTLGFNRLAGGSGDDHIFAPVSSAIAGGQGDDIIVAMGTLNRISGGEGNDTITTNGGFDIIHGDEGDDLLIALNGQLVFLYGGEGKDVIYVADGGTGRSFANGGDGNDYIYGGNGFDRISGGFGDESGNDILFGGDGDDIISGWSGRDLLFGGEGADRIFGHSGEDTLVGNAGEDVLRGGLGNDNLNGNRDNDILFGGDGEDELFGGSGDDKLFGEDGDDVLDGGAGFDKLSGEAGADTFVFSAGNEIDVIVDFEDGIDLIEAAGYTQSEVQTAIDNAFIASTFLILDFGNGDQLRLANIDLGDITIDDFA